MSREPNRYAVFLDRDGTLIEDRGHLGEPSEVWFLPGVMEALRRLREDFLFFIVTNQSGVAEGVLTLEQVAQVNAHVVSMLAGAGLKITATYVCPHRRGDGCPCIKPNPHFLHRAAAEYGVDLRRSFVVGDHPHDVELAKRAGAQGVYVCTGHGAKHLGELAEEEVVVPDICAAAEWILASCRTSRKLRGGECRIAGRRNGKGPRPMNDKTEVIPLNTDTLEVRYYDDGRPGKYRCWKIPLREVRDIARWWIETGSRVGADRPLPDAQRVGSVLVSFLSANHVYALGCDERGWSKITGYQLPRDAVAFLGAWLDQDPARKTPAAVPAADRLTPTAAQEVAP